MRNITTLFLLLLTNVLFGQKNFDYQKDFSDILIKTQDNKSNFYYESLIKRFISCDTTLSNEEIIALQIGQTKQKSYCPYAEIEIEKAIYELNGSGRYKASIELCNSYQKRNPLSLMLNLEKSYAFHKLDKADSSSIYFEKYLMLVHADISTGDGIKKPIFVLGPIDGQILIERYWQNNLGTMGSGKDSNGNFLDILEMKDPKTNESKTLNFIIEHASETMFNCP